MYTPDDHVPVLEPFADGLWVAKAPQRFFGLPMGTRMTVCRLPDGRLWVHSPIPLATVKNDLDALGDVAFAIAPNFIHHLYMGPFVAAYPDARLFVAPKLKKKRRDLSPEGVLTDEAPAGTWGAVFDQAVTQGSVLMDEVVFCHRPSRTLILCDLLECVDEHAPWWMRWLGRVGGIYQQPAPPWDLKKSFRDRDKARAFVERVLSFDFDRIIVSHGALIEAGGKQTFEDAYRFLLA